MQPWLSVVVPAYQESVHIAGTVDAVRDHLDALGRRWELIVVDNASPDGTAGEAERAAGGDERIRVLRNDANRGKGYSVQRGMLEAGGTLRLHCDADCAPSLASLPKLLALIEHADLVVGSRLADGASLGRRQPLRRRIAGVTFQRLCRLVLDEPTRDLYCGFKLWRADAAVAAYSRVRLEGWVFDAEVIAIARALGFRVTETGIVWADREGSRLSMPRVIVPAVRELLRARASARDARPDPAGLPAPEAGRA
jgi:dolichyl-phosphate beta-glucosyltransferase